MGLIASYCTDQRNLHYNQKLPSQNCENTSFKERFEKFQKYQALKSPETNFKVEIPKVTSKDFELNDRGRNKKNKRSFEDYHSINLSSQKNPGEIEM